MARISAPPASLHPRRQVAYARNNPVSASLVLGLIVVGIAVARGGGTQTVSTWSAKQWGSLAIAAAVVAGSAAFAPDIVTMLLVALLVVTALNNDALILGLLDRFSGSFNFLGGTR